MTIPKIPSTRPTIATGMTTTPQNGIQAIAQTADGYLWLGHDQTAGA